MLLFLQYDFFLSPPLFITLPIMEDQSRFRSRFKRKLSSLITFFPESLQACAARDSIISLFRLFYSNLSITVYCFCLICQLPIRKYFDRHNHSNANLIFSVIFSLFFEFFLFLFFYIGIHELSYYSRLNIQNCLTYNTLLKKESS